MRERETERRRRFDALFAAYTADIVAYCGWRAGSPHDARDAVSDVFLTAWRRLDELPDGDAARVWLHATARRVIANQRRSRRRRAALQERLSPAQIAAVTGCLTVTARGRLHRARRRFRAAFEELCAVDDAEQPRRDASAPSSPPVHSIQSLP